MPETTSATRSEETRPCRYCRQLIDPSATVCRFCSSDQRWYVKHFHVANLVSIALLGLSIWQFMEASDALDQAREAREATQDLAIGASEIILATLAVDKGRFMDFEPKHLTAPYVRRRVDRIFDALDLSEAERSAHLRVFRTYQQWEQAPENSPARDEAWARLQRLLQDDAV